MASYEDFQKLDIKVAEIESVTPHPNADRLYVCLLYTSDAADE